MSSTRKGPQLRWGLGTRSEPSEARARLLDAAMHCYEQLGVAKTSMADIAAQAKITRPTVYRYFSSHQDILKAVVRREIDKFWMELNNELKDIDDFAEYIIECLIYALRNSSSTRTHRFLFVQEIMPVMNDIFLGSREYLLDIAEALQPMFDEHKARGTIKPDVDLLMVCELFNRLAVSYVSSPSPFYQTEDELRHLFRSILPPMLGRV